MPLIYQEDSNCIAFGQFEFNGNDSEERISKLPIKERKKSRTFLFLNKYFKDGMDTEFEDHIGMEFCIHWQRNILLFLQFKNLDIKGFLPI